jgi:hypothetical protein
MDPLTIKPHSLLTLPFAAWPDIQGISDRKTKAIRFSAQCVVHSVRARANETALTTSAILDVDSIAINVPPRGPAAKGAIA